jgi:predicted P-loop ATPase
VRGFLSNPRTGIIDATHPENVKRVFEREGLALGWDSFYQMKTVTKDGRSMRVDDTVLIKVRMEAKRKHAITFAKEFWGDSIHDIATENPFHPVRDYLTELHWDGQPRIDTWLMKYLGAEDTIFNRTAGRLVLLAAVKRVIEPGAKFDQLLVLESKQGTGKSSSIAALCPNSEWYSDNLPIGAGSREVIEQTRGKWICEIAELFGMGKREIDQVKAFLSRQTDEARKVYARESDHVSRQFICIGTTNKQTYLQDPTGNRRFWPVKVSDSQDFEAVARDRDQLWAEAFESRASSLAFPRELWESAGILQREREDIHPWELKLTELIEQPKPEYLNRRTNGEVIGSEISITWEELFNVLDLNIDRRDKKSMGEISNIMVRLGFERANMRRDNTSNTRGWKRTR